MKQRKYAHAYSSNKQNPTKVAHKSHHVRSPGTWMPTVARELLDPKVKVFPTLSELDGDWS